VPTELTRNIMALIGSPSSSNAQSIQLSWLLLPTADLTENIQRYEIYCFLLPTYVATAVKAMCNIAFEFWLGFGSSNACVPFSYLNLFIRQLVALQ
jgi:hypothetical protein